MSPERKRTIATWAPTVFSGATLIGTMYFGAILSRIDRHVTNSLTVQDGVEWIAEAGVANPTLKLPDIRTIHWRNFDDEIRSMLRR